MLPRPHYIRKRGEGELAVRAAFANAILIRPAVMFGPDDAFLTPILKLLRQLPVYPMLRRGYFPPPKKGGSRPHPFRPAGVFLF